MNPWHYDLAEMEAVTNGGSMAELREYCVSAVREFHTGGLRFAVNLAAYEDSMQDRLRVTTAQLLYLYRQLVHNDHMRRTVALEWLRRHYPEDAKSELQRIVPHSDHWFSIVDRVEPRLGAIARINIEASGGVDGCSACGDPAEDDCQRCRGHAGRSLPPPVRRLRRHPQRQWRDLRTAGRLIAIAHAVALSSPAIRASRGGRSGAVGVVGGRVSRPVVRLQREAPQRKRVADVTRRDQWREPAWA